MSELLAKLTAKGVPITPDPIGGGIPAVTWDMVAGACRGMTRHMYLYALAKFCGDQVVIHELRILNRHSTRHIARVKRWKTDRLERFDKLSDLALSEALHGRMCGHCGGTGLQHNQKACPVCHGRKVEKLNKTQAANELGITRKAWGQFWQHRYEFLTGDLEAMDSQIGRMIRKEVYGD